LEKKLHETMVEMETLPKKFEWPPKATLSSQGFDHPPLSEEDIKRIKDKEDAEADKEAPTSLASFLAMLKQQQPPPPQQNKKVTSYAFCDEGSCININISMEDVGIQCSDQDISLNWDAYSLSLDVKNYGPDKQTVRLSFSKLSDEIIDATYKLEKDEIVLTLKKKNPDVEWKSVTTK
jgi:hypothetical protein